MVRQRLVQSRGLMMVVICLSMAPHCKKSMVAMPRMNEPFLVHLNFFEWQRRAKKKKNERSVGNKTRTVPKLAKCLTKRESNKRRIYCPSLLVYPYHHDLPTMPTRSRYPKSSPSSLPTSLHHPILCMPAEPITWLGPFTPNYNAIKKDYWYEYDDNQSYSKNKD